jgi:hypothetical protein
MASDIAAPGRYTAAEIEDGREHRLGTVVLDAQGIMAVVSVGDEIDVDKRDRLQQIADRMNEKPVMYVDVPPPEGAPRFTLASRGVKRGDAAFIPALKNYLRTFYSVELRPE